MMIDSDKLSLLELLGLVGWTQKILAEKMQVNPAEVGGFEYGTPKMCYANSVKQALINNLIYVEGFGILRGFGLPISHAWCVERGSLNVIDVTSDKFESYCGVPFKTEYVEERQLNQKYVNLIDNWHEGYPLFHMTDEEVWDKISTEIPLKL